MTCNFFYHLNKKTSDKLDKYLLGSSKFSSNKFQYSSPNLMHSCVSSCSNQKRDLRRVLVLRSKSWKTKSSRISKSFSPWTACIWMECRHAIIISLILVQDQDVCPGHPGCRVFLTLTVASTASLVSPGMFPPGRHVLFDGSWVYECLKTVRTLFCPSV